MGFPAELKTTRDNSHEVRSYLDRVTLWVVYLQFEPYLLDAMEWVGTLERSGKTAGNQRLRPWDS